MTYTQLFIVDQRPEGWFIGPTEIMVDTSNTNLLTEATARAIGLEGRQHYRLRRCKMCDNRFIAHMSRKLCSAECIAKNIKAHNDAAAAKRAERRRPRTPAISRAERRQQAREGKECVACGAPLQARRSSKTTCSDKCRQWVHRNPDEAAANARAIAGARRYRA